jgi:acetoin utilization protein AcuB
MFVREFMSSPAVTIGPNASLAEAEERMRRHGVRRLPVVEDGRLVGIVTRSDIQSAAGRMSGKRHQRIASRVHVRDVMTPGPTCVPPDETIERAAAIMFNRKISGLPVVNGTAVVGMITETDLFRALVEILGFRERGARLVIDLDEPERLVDRLRSLGRRLHIRTVVTYRDGRGGRWKAVVRLRGRKPQPASATAE